MPPNKKCLFAKTSRIKTLRRRKNINNLDVYFGRLYIRKHTHTHTHSCSHEHTHVCSPTRTHSHTLSLFLSHSLTRTQTHANKPWHSPKGLRAPTVQTIEPRRTTMSQLICRVKPSKVLESLLSHCPLSKQRINASKFLVQPAPQISLQRPSFSGLQIKWNQQNPLWRKTQRH